jgi:ribose-phosphate pyrophosphokinase
VKEKSMNSQSAPVIFALRRGGQFAAALARQLKTNISPSQTLNFSDGNIFVQLLTPVNHRAVLLVQSVAGTAVDSDFLELAFYADAAKRAGAARVTAVIPYFSYAKADKHDFPGTSLRARVCADTLQVAGVTDVMMMDLHSPSIPGFFGVPVQHLSARDLICERIKKMKLPHLVVVSPDAGFAKNARYFAAYLNRACVVCDKNRPDHSEKPCVLEIIGDIRGKTAVIVDDFTTSGGTLIEVAKELLSAGAISVMAAVAHAPVARAALKKLSVSPLTNILTTNSVDGIVALGADFPKLTVLDVSGLFAAAY